VVSQQQHNRLASVSQGWRSAAAFQLRIAPGRLEFQRSQHAVSGMYVGHWCRRIVCGIVGGRISSSFLVRVSGGGSCFALLFFAPILQHRQVEDGQFVHNLLDNRALFQNEDMDVFECVVHPKKIGQKLWVMSWCERSFVALLVESNSLWHSSFLVGI
jgi:hypothetical protein